MNIRTGFDAEELDFFVEIEPREAASLLTIYPPCGHATAVEDVRMRVAELRAMADMVIEADNEDGIRRFEADDVEMTFDAQDDQVKISVDIRNVRVADYHLQRRFAEDLAAFLTSQADLLERLR
jgi:hypothetical protein